MPKYPTLNCFFCENEDIYIPQMGIATGMSGDDYSFCENCIKSLSADEFWRRIIEKLGFAYPPTLTKEIIEELNHPEEIEYFPYAPASNKNSRELLERRKMSNALRYEILKRDGFKCKLCGATREDDKLNIDHIKPISKGGKTIKENLRTLCQRCNSGKGSKAE
ncbi:MAG: HNH endonuclease [candidate division Zixibacteria bacterium]|nr:HNH endonuclease [candidate division Zixibacteria bacterium]